MLRIVRYSSVLMESHKRGLAQANRSTNFAVLPLATYSNRHQPPPQDSSCPLFLPPVWLCDYPVDLCRHSYWMILMHLIYLIRIPLIGGRRWSLRWTSVRLRIYSPAFLISDFLTVRKLSLSLIAGAMTVLAIPNFLHSAPQSSSGQILLKRRGHSRRSQLSGSCCWLFSCWRSLGRGSVSF